MIFQHSGAARAGRKEDLITILEHGQAEKTLFEELHVMPRFIEKYLGHAYRGPEDDVTFALIIGKNMIKPFWLGVKWLRPDGKAFGSVEELKEFSKGMPLGLTQEQKEGVVKAKRLADDANLLCMVQTTGILSYAWTMMGFEQFLMDLYLEPEKAHDVIALLVERNRAIGRDLVELGLECVVLTDDIAGKNGLIVSPAIYDEMILPAMEEIIRSYEDMYVIYHSDGNIDPVLPQLIRAGIDGFQSIEHDLMDLGETKAKYPNLTLFGNVPNMLIHTGTPEQIDASVRECVEVGAPGGNFAVCSDNSIPEFISLENFRAYVDAVHKYNGIERLHERIGEK